MHIEPGVVDGAKMAISYATVAGVIAFTVQGLVKDVLKGQVGRVLLCAFLATVITVFSFEVLPHPSVGVSEVHLILGSTMLLFLGVAPTALGLMIGLTLQGLIFAPSDLPQLSMNVTTLLASLLVTAAALKRLAPENSRYVDLSYAAVAKLSLLFQGSIVAWVSFWVVLGQGASASTLQSLSVFGVSYLSVVAIEVLINIALLAALRARTSGVLSKTLNPRLFEQSSV